MKLNVYSQASPFWKLPDLTADIPFKTPFFEVYRELWPTNQCVRFRKQLCCSPKNKSLYETNLPLYILQEPINRLLQNKWNKNEQFKASRFSDYNCERPGHEPAITVKYPQKKKQSNPNCQTNVTPSSANPFPYTRNKF